MDYNYLWINAAKLGLLDDIIYLHSLEFSGCTKEVIDKASKYGHLNIVYFLLTNRKEGCTSDAFNWAAIKGHIDIFNILYSYFPDRCKLSKCIKYATSYKQKEMSIVLYKIRKHIYWVNPEKKCVECNVIITELNRSRRVKKRCKKCHNNLMNCYNRNRYIQLKNSS